MASEHKEQCTVVKWLSLQYPRVKYFAIPNGTWAKNVLAARKMVREGARSGVPDLFIPEWMLFIEMKRDAKGRLTDEQKEWRDYLISVGYNFIEGYGSKDAIEKIIKFKGENDGLKNSKREGTLYGR